MPFRARLAALALAASVVASVFVSAFASASAAAAPRRCAVTDLRATFSHVPDSDATGHTLYALRIVSRGGSCVLVGDAKLQLLGARGQSLPTDLLGRITPGTITRSGFAADLELSPDLFGPGEPENGPCEPTAERLRLTTSAGQLTAAVTPPTPVCERGRMRVISG